MKESKHNQIRNHLLEGKSITGLEAIKLYSVYRLSSVINRLRNEGFDIKTQMIQEKGKGDETTYAMYFIPYR